MSNSNRVRIISSFREKISPISESRWHVDSDVLIDVDNLTLTLGNETVLSDVSFCVHSGEFLGIIGPNGAGKTSLLRCVLGLIKPTSGSVRRLSARVGYIPQRGAVYGGMVPLSVLEVVRLGARGATILAREALEQVGMSEMADRRFTELSGGQQQRVGIAKALAARADVLILDEPTTGIDERSQAEFYRLLGQLSGRGITVLMVSHEVDTVLKLVTRVICLNGGVLYDGSPQHFEQDKYMPKSYTAQHRWLHHHDHSGDEVREGE